MFYELIVHEWAIGLFIQGFCVSLVRPGILIFLILVLAGKLGRGIGLPILFWRPLEKSDNPQAGQTKPAKFAQFMVGIGVGALIWQVILAGYLFEEFATNYTLDRPPFCEVRTLQNNGLEKYATDVPEGNLRWLGLDMPPVHEDFGKRFRYDPLAYSSLWIYTSNLFVGSIVVAIGAGLLSLILPVINWLFTRATTWTPFRYTSKPAPLPRSVFLPVGVLIGLLAMSIITVLLFNTYTAQVTGQAMTQVADWGTASGRQAVIRQKIERFKAEHAEKPDPQAIDKANKPEKVLAMDESAKAKAWYAPYYPVYGAFLLNFALITVSSVVLMCLPRSWLLFSPAVGIVLLLNILIASSTLLNYFSPIPGEFVTLLLLTVVAISGRAYKLKFRNINGYYRRPLDLNEFYQERAKLEAQQVAASAALPASTHSSPTVWMTGQKPGTEAGAAIPQLDDVFPITGEQPPIATESSLLDSEHIPFGVTQNRAEMKSVPRARAGVIREMTAFVPDPKLPKLAILCVSGGGSRAAAWTMRSLIEIERAFANPSVVSKECEAMPPLAFPYQVRLVTGASGGMIAASYYVASLAAPNPGTTDVIRNSSGNQPLTTDQMFEDVCADFLTPITHTLVSRDLPSLPVPSHLGRSDRGETMEREWVRILRGQLDQNFADLRPGEEAGWRPSLIFSPMMIEDGRQLFISNLDLHRVVRNSAQILGEVDNTGQTSPLNPFDRRGRRLLSREGFEFFKAFPEAKDFKLSTAARMSASFPYVLPAAYLPTNPPRRVVDAGYYDNYGVNIASSWLFNHIEWVKTHTSGVVVIQIRDGSSGPQRRREHVSDSFPSPLTAGLHWLTSPPEGLWAFRQSAQMFRNDNLLHLLSEFYAAKDLPDGFLSTVAFEFDKGDDVALNFTLTEGERKTIEDAIANSYFRTQLAALLEWWHS